MLPSGFNKLNIITYTGLHFILHLWKTLPIWMDPVDLPTSWIKLATLFKPQVCDTCLTHIWWFPTKDQNPTFWRQQRQAFPPTCPGSGTTHLLQHLEPAKLLNVKNDSKDAKPLQTSKKSCHTIFYRQTSLLVLPGATAALHLPE